MRVWINEFLRPLPSGEFTGIRVLSVSECPFMFTPALLDAVRAQAAREAEVLEQIRAGRYDGRYARVATG